MAYLTEAAKKSKAEADKVNKKFNEAMGILVS